MKETPYSKIEKSFLKGALSERKRLDGRQFDERRNLRLNFGKEYGCCHVSLGETRVLAQVSSEIQAPKSTRPNEGHIYINVEFSPMSAEHVEPGKPSEACIEVNRVLEKCLRESKCVDLESLCIIAEEKVWALRVDLTVLNMEGNIIECASVAALSALAHFRRPDVTSTGDRIIVHDASEKEPLPTALHHYPICLTYAIFNKGKHIVADPTLIEEQCAEASFSVGMNAYRELCGMHLGGHALSDHNSILKVVQKAGTAAANVVQFVKKSLEEDEIARTKNEVMGLSACIRAGRITSVCDQQMKVKINSSSIHETAEKLIAQRAHNKHTKWDEDGNEHTSAPTNKIIVNLGDYSVELRDADEKMDTLSDESMEESDEDKVEEIENEEENEDEQSEKEDGQEKVEGDSKMEEDDSEKEEKSAPLKAFKKSLKKEGKQKQVKMKKSPKKATGASQMDDESDDELQVVQELTKEEKERMKRVETLVLDDSEEEVTTTLTAGELETPQNNSKKTPGKKKQRNRRKKSETSDKSEARQWYAKNTW